MPTFTSPPILVYQPGGGTPSGPISNPPVYSQHDVTPLVQGQAYVDVVFGAIQTTEDWVLVECNVVNELDLAPLNIWPGIITDRTTAGFRLQLNGLPDSGNYYLHWAVSGVNIAPYPATLYLFTGPTSGTFGVDKTFTVKLPPSTTLAVPVTITPDDGGAGGIFSPTTVTLSSGMGTATFTYSAVSYGARTISVTNSGTLLDPAPIVYTSIAPIYTLSGPSGGDNGVPSTNFTVQVAGEATLAMPTTVTPHATGGGTFTPTTVLLTVGGVPVHFTYTPSSVGTKTISVTNDGGLVDPASLTYVAAFVAAPFLDNFTGGPIALNLHTADSGEAWAGGSGIAHIDAGSVYGGAAGGDEVLVAYTPASADCEASITIIKGAVSGASEVGMWLRANAAGPDGYMGRYVEGSGWQFYRMNSGAFTQVGVSTAGTLANGDVLRFTVAGTGATVTLTLYKNGVSQYTANDTSGSRIVTNGIIGIHIFDSTSGTGNYRINTMTTP